MWKCLLKDRSAYIQKNPLNSPVGEYRGMFSGKSQLAWRSGPGIHGRHHQSAEADDNRYFFSLVGEMVLIEVVSTIDGND